MQDLPDQTQRMLDFYGLARNPFGEQVDATVFSGAGDRFEAVEQLKHLLTFSPQDCLILAPAGGGKKALAQQVLRQLDDEWRVAWIDGRETQLLDAVTRELIGQLGLGLRADGDTAGLYRTIADVIDQRTADGENFLLVVEEADQFGVDVQQWLQSLRSLTTRIDNRLRQLWLTASATAIDQAENDDQWYCLVLEPFTNEDALVYLKDRFTAAGQREGVPIEAKDVNRLNQMAAGLPGGLNQVAEDYLIAGTFKTTERRQGFPLTHVLAGAAVVTLIVLSVVYSGQSEPEKAVPETATTEEPTADESVSDVQQRLAEAAARVESRRKEGGVAASADSEPSSSIETQQADKANEASPNTVGEAAETTQSAAEQTGSGVTTAQATQNSPAPPTQDPPAPPTQDSPAPQPAPADKTEAAKASTSASRWLATAPDSHYTLQLLGVRDRSAVEQVVSGLSNPGNFKIVETRHEGRPWFVLIHGEYQDADAARTAVKTLPDAFSGQSPWPRTFASLKSSMQ